MVEGQGKPGFVKGNAAIALRPEGETTIVDVSGSVETGGPIARLGQAAHRQRFEDDAGQIFRVSPGKNLRSKGKGQRAKVRFKGQV
jgi:carbon monoxide dehydrogenase subunit G